MEWMTDILNTINLRKTRKKYKIYSKKNRKKLGTN